MKNLLAGFLVAALASCFSPPSQAAEANWKQTQYWTITGDYIGYCRAEEAFDSGMLVSIGLNKDGWKLMIAAKGTIPMETGKTYTLDVALEGKSHATLNGVAFDPQGIAFSDLTPQFIRDFALAPSIMIGDLGKFNLAGSADAIIETYACFKAITSAGAKASSIQKDREA
jgi:hypothetical protein